jgi:hypothetical protein
MDPRSMEIADVLLKTALSNTPVQDLVRLALHYHTWAVRRSLICAHLQCTSDGCLQIVGMRCECEYCWKTYTRIISSLVQPGTDRDRWCTLIEQDMAFVKHGPLSGLRNQRDFRRVVASTLIQSWWRSMLLRKRHRIESHNMVVACIPWIWVYAPVTAAIASYL